MNTSNTTSDEGKFEEKLVSIPADETVHKGWLPYSENNVLRQSFRFLGELYGWCGLEEGVDCSLFTADVYRSFGLDIPGDAVEQRTAIVRGTSLTGARVRARDLRGGAALTLAALAAKDYSEIENVALIDRGYERLEEQLSSLGADIRRIRS